MSAEDPRLGRIVPPDFDHLNEHPMARMLPAVPAPTLPTKRWWSQPLDYDQGVIPDCTCVAACQAMTAVTLAQTGVVWRFDPLPVYAYAQSIDGMPVPHDGSTAKAAFQALAAVGAHEVSNGQDAAVVTLTKYVWTQAIADVITALLTTGPVVIGVDWFSGMMQPDANHVIHPTGSVVGGHAVFVQGVDTVAGFVTVKNSWAGWGWAGPDPGDALLAISDLELLLGRDGEACLAIVQTTPAATT